MTIQPKTRGQRMKINGAPATSVPFAPAVDAASAAAAPVSAPSAAPLQSDLLAPAREALAAMPDFDQAKVSELRDALARGELPFDASRLAGLIQRFHGKTR
jgi:negative regulator of flagellin synthesis FlgM